MQLAVRVTLLNTIRVHPPLVFTEAHCAIDPCRAQQENGFATGTQLRKGKHKLVLASFPDLPR